MQVEIKYNPAYALAICSLTQGEQLKAEAGAMCSMSADVTMDTSTQGGMMMGLKRSVLGGESFFMNTFTANAPRSEITFSPALPGGIVHWPLQGQTVYLQSGSYIASSTSIDVDSSWGGSKTFFSKEGLFVLKCSGTGDLLVSSYGAIHMMDLQPGQQYVVDTGHMVGWSEGITYEVTKASSGWKSTLLGGEGLVCKLTGPGRIYLQTRSPDAFIAWITPQLPTQRS